MKDLILSLLGILYFTLPVLIPFLYLAFTVVVAFSCFLFLGKYRYFSAFSVVLFSLVYAMRDTDVYWLYKDYCDKLGGLTVYVSPEEWKLVHDFTLSDDQKLSRKYPEYRMLRRQKHLMKNDLYYVLEHYAVGRGIEMEVESVIDDRDEIVLMERVDFARRQPSYESRFWDVSIYMYWLFSDSCVNQANRYAWLLNGKGFFQYMPIYRTSAEGE